MKKTTFLGIFIAGFVIFFTLLMLHGCTYVDPPSPRSETQQQPEAMRDNPQPKNLRKTLDVLFIPRVAR